MNIREARRKAHLKIFVGFTVAALSFVTSVISTLLMMYHRLDDGTQMGRIIATPFKQLVALCYENSSALHWLWEIAPIPDPYDLLAASNVWFFLLYFCIFLGSAMASSGLKLLKRIRKIHEGIEDQIIKESIAGKPPRSKNQIIESINIPASSVWAQWHQLYLAPIVTAVVAALLLKFVFGV